MEKKNDIEREKVKTLKEIKFQFDIIINLLAQRILNPKEIKESITKKRKNPDRIIESFNSCDGETALTEIAKKCGIDPGNFSRDINSWERNGFLIKIIKKGIVYPKALIYLK